ncbi:sulfite exporter TauE/SafE family protein [Pseudorhodobacter sp.]|uniref:sulfite exporter TauE/SafE family protein n=1 Tax=Pseudorhodobacter sp. TaxID=1934400 RepID=UPI002B0005CB|nr:sulfite exporter TauE/SafE family protein [Pseudorhodobacter sp.]
MTLPFDLSLAAAAYMAVVLFGAAFVRGYSGFGFSALTVTGAALATNPLHFVGVVLMLEFLITFQQWNGVWRDVDWRRVAALMVGSSVGVPLGLWAITQIPPDAARAVIAVYVLGMCAVLMRGWVLTRPQTLPAHAAVGGVAGLANAVGMGGAASGDLFHGASAGLAGFSGHIDCLFRVAGWAYRAFDVVARPDYCGYADRNAGRAARGGWRRLAGWAALSEHRPARLSTLCDCASGGFGDAGVGKGRDVKGQACARFW